MGMSTKIIGLAGLVAVAVFAAAFLLKSPESQVASVAQPSVATTTQEPATESPAATGAPAKAVAEPAAPKPASAPAPAPAPAPQGYTLAQVAAHNSSSSCWSAINGKVYDLTSWISKHPGGKQAIVSMCGRDGSAAYNGQHGGERRPANELAGFYLAPLI